MVSRTQGKNEKLHLLVESAATLSHHYRDYRNNHGNGVFATNLWCIICHRGPLLALVIYYFQALAYKFGLLTCEQFDR